MDTAVRDVSLVVWGSTTQRFAPGRRAPGALQADISDQKPVYTKAVSKHLVDLDEQALNLAQARLGTSTIKDTVNAALRRAGEDRDAKVAAALDILSRAQLVDRVEAWR